MQRELITSFPPIYDGDNDDDDDDALFVQASIIDVCLRNKLRLPVGDKSSPEDIMATTELSKKGFKIAIGGLRKRGLIVAQDNTTELLYHAYVEERFTHMQDHINALENRITKLKYRSDDEFMGHREDNYGI